jgi:hypothetical protein
MAKKTDGERRLNSTASSTKSTETMAYRRDGSGECHLHVRHIGIGGCKSEELLRQVFAPYGHLLVARIRNRRDPDGGADTSWALVTMESAAAAQSALEAVVMAPDGSTQLKVTAYSSKQAAASTGEMKRMVSSMDTVTDAIKYLASKVGLIKNTDTHSSDDEGGEDDEVQSNSMWIQHMLLEEGHLDPRGGACQVRLIFLYYRLITHSRCLVVILAWWIVRYEQSRGSEE